jgi:hypothetical protein
MALIARGYNYSVYASFASEAQEGGREGGRRKNTRLSFSHFSVLIKAGKVSFW